MSKHNPYPDESDLQVRVMVGDQVAIAWLWLLAYLDNVNKRITDYADDNHESYNLITIDEFIDTGITGDYITRGGVFEGFHLDPLYWEKLSILKETEIEPSRYGFFNCSC